MWRIRVQISLKRVKLGCIDHCLEVFETLYLIEIEFFKWSVIISNFPIRYKWFRLSNISTGTILLFFVVVHKHLVHNLLLFWLTPCPQSPLVLTDSLSATSSCSDSSYFILSCNFWQWLINIKITTIIFSNRQTHIRLPLLHFQCHYYYIHQLEVVKVFELVEVQLYPQSHLALYYNFRILFYYKFQNSI